MIRNNPLIILVAILFIGIAATLAILAFRFSSDTPTTASAATDAETETVLVDGVERPAGWTEESHSDSAEPNYEVVFPEDEVNQITITISPENWEAMQADMTELYGEPGSREQGGPGGGGQFPGGNPPASGVMPTDTLTTTESITATEGITPTEGAPQGGQFPQGGMPGMGGGEMVTENPMWVNATIDFEGTTWTNVGLRYKGNSSLSGSWNDQTLKLPFKLDFDQFEDDYPTIDNQRFYGFKQISLSNNYGDASDMRDTLTYDLLDAAGLPSAETAAYEVILDYGEGQVSLGMYTAIEVIDDTAVATNFGEDSGNIYEGDGQGVTLADGTYDLIEASFQKENNETEADWSDVQALYTVLNSEERTTDPEAWRTKLDAIFDTDGFLEWLALSTIIEHWDTYGAMTHNFYLYNDPDTGKLTWISWDHNFVLGAMGGGGGGGFPGGQNGEMPQGAPTDGQAPPVAATPGADTADGQVVPPDMAQGGFPGGGRGGRGGPGNRSTTFDKSDVTADWPLIRYLLDDATYYDKYIEHMEELNATVFKPDTLIAAVEARADMLAHYADKEQGEAEFDTAIQTLIDSINERSAATTEFLATQ